MNWSKTDINHVKTSLDRLNISGLSRELGICRSDVKAKVREIQLMDRLKSMLRTEVK